MRLIREYESQGLTTHSKFYTGFLTTESTEDTEIFLLGPDLAVEVISPSNKAGDIHLKVMQLLNAGTGLIWLVYPESRAVVAHISDSATIFHENDTLSGGDALPGFQLRVGDIFPS